MRRKGDRALLEGPHLVAEAGAAGLELETVLATSEFLARASARGLLAALPSRPEEVTPRLLESLTDADSPRGILAVCRLPRAGVEALPVRPEGIYLYADRMQDPGNLGALARVAEALGAAALVLAPGSVHPNHPRALRASAGSLLRFPTAIEVEPTELVERLRPASPRWIALTPRGGDEPTADDLHGTLVLAVGAEGPGLSPRAAEGAAIRWTIPVKDPVESLNVTVAAALALFEIRRRRQG